MYNSICFEPVDVDQEQAVSGGAALAASGTSIASIANDIIAFSPARGGGGPPGTFLGAVAKALALAGLVGTITLATGGTFTTSLNSPD